MCSEVANVGEAVPIVGALACDLAERMSVRALLIKGAPATALGVRARRPSVDADIWVDPVRHDEYLELLDARGWKVSKSGATGVGWGHAVTVQHPDWPSTIDVHRSFPGFLCSDDVAFERVWRSRGRAHVAHQDVPVPSRVAGAAITVLHAARSTTISGTDDDRACALHAARSFMPNEVRELADLVAATGSAEPLADLLAAARCDVSTSSIVDEKRLEQWRIRTSVGAKPGGGWLLALRGAPWRRRPGLVLAAAAPTDRDYAESGAGRTFGGWVRAAVYRWRRSARALPGAVRDVRAAVAARGR